jgi:hypothetical protein
VPSDRLLRVLTRLAERDGVEPGLVALCDVAADVSGTTGAGIILMSDDLRQGALCASDGLSAVVGELQLTLGEGPGVDACLQGDPTLEANLEEPGTRRWFAFGPAAVAAGARAVFGFPLQVGAIRLGALSLCRDCPGELGPEEHADALVMASAAAHAVLALQAGAPPSSLSVEIQSSANLRGVVHQASGMVSVQLDVTVTEALIRLRGHAMSRNRLVEEVAKDVVARRVRFDEPDGMAVRD